MEAVVSPTTINLNKVCRACLMEYDEMHSIFSAIQNEEVDDEPTFLCHILMSISTIRVSSEDGLPSMLCTNCMELAHTSFKFQQQCNRSQEILDAYTVQLQNELSEPKIEETPEEVLEYLTKDDDQMQPIRDQIKEAQRSSREYVNVKIENDAESTLDAAKVAASEDNVKLRQRLAIKRMKSESPAVKSDQKAISSYFSVDLNENGKKVYKCNNCGKTYKHANSLKIHVRSHTMERPYICNHCGKGFKQYGALTYHLRAHTGEQPYGCKICGKRYRQSGTLTAHMRVHTGQKPFLCSVCGRGFRQAPDLGYHMRTHTKERPYMCNVCGKTMRMQCHLVQHMRIHTGERPFKCTECNKAFPSSTRLKRHAIIHTGLKPYTCEVCCKSFNRLSSLRVHAKIHTDERPHVCSVCGKGFIQAHALRGHMHSHAPADSFYKNE